MTQAAKDAVQYIAKQAPGFSAKLGIILGSGLGALAEIIEEKIIIPYHDLPNFPKCSVSGHSGSIVLGKLQGLPVACLSGRVHLYEGISNDAVLTQIRTLRLLGCETLFVTNSAGAINVQYKPGDLVALSDHINFQFNNPLVGCLDDEFGQRFVGMENAYDKEYRQHLLAISKRLNLSLAEGVYVAVLGPSFETPAEINAFRTLGADVVGMSTVPEVITARHCGMRIVAISVVTNMAAGLHEVQLSHDVTLQGAKKAEKNLILLTLEFIKENFATV